MAVLDINLEIPQSANNQKKGLDIDLSNILAGNTLKTSDLFPKDPDIQPTRNPQEEASISQMGLALGTETDTNNNTVTSIRANNTGTYRTGNINLVNGSNVTITETSSGVFNFAATNTQIAARLAGVGLTLNSNTFDVNTWGAVAGTLNPTQGDTSGKWYKVNTDASDKLVVNVPWTDTTTNTQNVYAVSAADGTNTSREKIVLSGSGHNGTTTDFVEIGAGTGLSIARAGDVITLTNTVVNTNTIYSAGNNLTLTGTVLTFPF